MRVWMFIAGEHLYLYLFGKGLKQNQDWLLTYICILRIKDRIALFLLCQDLNFVHLKK